MRHVIITRHDAVADFIRNQIPDFATAPVIHAVETLSVFNDTVVATDLLTVNVACHVKEIILLDFEQGRPAGNLTPEQIIAAEPFFRRFEIKQLERPPVNINHLRIESQPEPYEDGTWEIHQQDRTGKWYRPVGGPIYPLFDPPTPNLVARYCKAHDQMEWVRK